MTDALREASVRRGRHRDAEALLGLRDYVARYRSELIEQMDQPGACGVALARKHAAIADELARRVFEQARTGCDELPLLLGAVGGYGRGLLALGSDLDLCFVTTAPAEAVGACVEAMLYPLWDAGVRVGHQVVWPSEVVSDATADLTIATELLDFRPLVGDVSLMQSVEERLRASIFSESKIGTFILQLETGAKKRHQQFGDSVYLLEPDLKNGTGGLRDLDSALWACRARFGTSDLAALADLGVISPQSQAEAQRALEFLWTVRNHLHRALGRKADRLTFAEQERVARAMGYAPPGEHPVIELRRTGEMVEAFMSDYYRHARIIAQTRARLLGRAKRGSIGVAPRIREFGRGMVECDGSLGLAQPERIHSEPTLAFQVYRIALARDMPVLSHTREAIARATQDEAFAAELRASEQAAELFVALVCSSRPAPFASGSVLTELHDVGLLLAMIPEFVPLVGRVHHDLYHVYTVDVHSIAAVDRLHALVRGDLARDYPLASRLAAETLRPRVLFLATLLHDIGKAIGGRNHARRGAEMARTILERLRFTADEIDDARRLIRHHLTMYMVAIRRDLNDPGTITEFVRDSWDRESLRELYLLTVADVSTTSAEAMTPWKRSMLDALFRSSDAFLAGALVGLDDRVERVKDRARVIAGQNRQETVGEQ
ncbi:MAG TPA: HD domain-containing protein [Polyangiaceae bacterium]